VQPDVAARLAELGRSLARHGPGLRPGRPHGQWLPQQLPPVHGLLAGPGPEALPEPDARALALESKAAGKPPRSCSIRPRLLSAADRLTVGYLAAPGAPQSVRRNEEFSVHRTKVRQQPPCPPRITQCSVQETELLKPISARIGHDQGR